MKTIKTVQKQSEFCLAQMVKLHEKIKNAEVDYGRIKYHTRMEGDIVRLRRELNELHDMLMQFGY